MTNPVKKMRKLRGRRTAGQTAVKGPSSRGFWRRWPRWPSLVLGAVTFSPPLFSASCTVPARVSPAGTYVRGVDGPQSSPDVGASRSALSATPAGHRDAQDEGWDEQGWDNEDWSEEEDEGVGRSFLYKELVLTGLYSVDGVVGIPPDDPNEDHWEFSPRPPGNYLGLDYVRTFSSASPINKRLPDWFQLSAIDLHPRFLFDRMETENGLHQVDFAPQDFWARFNLGGVDRLTLRIGQFVLPYGVNPPLAPRQKFILPVEALDLGLKWDWGVDIKGPIGEYDWEIAATIGSGEALHSTHLFRSSDRTSYLFTGRIGTPTYWDFQYGLSFLVGDLPMIRAANVMNETAISRWRVGFDTLYKYGTYLMAGAQVTYGHDGFAGDEEHVAITGGKRAEVLGYRVWLDWVLPMHDDLRLGAQFESVIRDLSNSDSDDTAVIIEAAYSFTTTVSVMLDYRVELSRSMGEESDALYLTFIYYGL